MNTQNIASISNWDFVYKDDSYNKFCKLHDIYTGNENYAEEMSLAILKEFSMLEIIFLYLGDINDFRTED